jgi:hypothetical protein
VPAVLMVIMALVMTMTSVTITPAGHYPHQGREEHANGLQHS